MLGRRRDFYLGSGTLILFACSALLVAFDPLRPFALSSGDVNLRASIVEGRIRVEWNGVSAIVRNAQSATLEVLDGGLRNRYPVEKSFLEVGSLDYLRKSNDALVELTFFREGKPIWRGSVRALGPAAGSPSGI